jgi:hypothetical protein
MSLEVFRKVAIDWDRVYAISRIEEDAIKTTQGSTKVYADMPGVGVNVESAVLTDQIERGQLWRRAAESGFALSGTYAIDLSKVCMIHVGESDDETFITFDLNHAKGRFNIERDAALGLLQLSRIK